MGHQYLKNVTTLQFDPEKCTGCGMCTCVCPRHVYILKDHKASIISKDNCIECGACAINCPFSAIKVSSGTGCAYAVIKTMLSKNTTEASECT